MGRNYLDDMEFIESPNHSSRGGEKPRMVVMHYTADTSMRAVNFFKEKSARASAHYVVTRLGKIYQMVDLDRSAWHAGWNAKTSFLRERLGIVKPNRSSVGIEIVNAGELNRRPYQTWYGEQIPADEVMIYDGQPWQTYAEPQIIAVAQLVTFLCNELDIPRRFMFDGQEGCTINGVEYETVPYYIPAGSAKNGCRMKAWRFKDNAGVLGHCHTSAGKPDPGPAIELWRGALGIK